LRRERQSNSLSPGNPSIQALLRSAVTQ
jgi:hypothetical protein